MTEIKHSPLPLPLTLERGIGYGPDEEYKDINDADGHTVMGYVPTEQARFIVLACNHFEEMREQIESATTMYGMNDAKCVADSATELLAKLKEAEDE